MTGITHLLDVRAVADFLGVTVQHVYQLSTKGELGATAEQRNSHGQNVLTFDRFEIERYAGRRLPPTSM